MGTNVVAGVLIALAMSTLGVGAFLAVQLPVLVLAATIGVWLFFVQHQFEHTYWEDAPRWNAREAALAGSSHYDLPRVLRWLTANIGMSCRVGASGSSMLSSITVAPPLCVRYRDVISRE